MTTSRHRPARLAFSLMEVLVSLSILGMAAAALLLTNETMSLHSRDAIARTVAKGIAEQLLDDIAGARYVEVGESWTVLPLGAESGETATPPKSSLFDDLDDYHRLDLNPLVDAWGITLGQGNGAGGKRAVDFRLPDGYFANWRAVVTISYVNESNPSVDLLGTSTSGMRAATVVVSRVVDGATQELARMRRSFAYVPKL